MKAKETVKKTDSKYSAETFISKARLSGSALRVTTIKNSGIYPVDSEKKSGSPIIVSYLYSLAGGKGEAVEASKVGKLLSSLDFSTTEGKKLLSLLPPKYNNFKTFRSRILKGIEEGAILSFSPKK